MPAPDFPECVDGAKISLVKFNWGHIMNAEAVTIGLDLAKNVFQLQGVGLSSASSYGDRKSLRLSVSSLRAWSASDLAEARIAGEGRWRRLATKFV